MNIYEEYEVDIKAKDIEGIWVELRPGLEVKTRHLTNPDTKKLLKRLRAPYQGRGKKKLTDDIQAEHVIQAICRTTLLDWKGFTDRKGKELKFSPEAALDILQDPAMCLLTDDIVLAVSELDVFNKKELEEAEKNLKKSSNGGSSGGSKQKS